jgi:two-component system, probable response regulator PhcQ
MQGNYDYKQFAVLYVDDEEPSLKYFTRAFESQFRILTAGSAMEGLRLIEDHADEIGVLITDQRMPGQNGNWLLEKTRQLRPRIIRILVTAYSDIQATITAVNSGSIYKYITKPWDPHQIEATLKRALEFFIVQRERDILLKEKVSVLHNMMIADRVLSLGFLAAGMSHHIRNSLVAIKTFLDLAPAKLKEENVHLETLRDPDFWKEYYQNVQRQIERIDRLLGDLWAASEPPRPQFNDEISLRDLVTRVIASLNGQLAAKNITLQNLIPESLPHIIADLPKMQRMFELLLKDEVVSLPPGSNITFSAEWQQGATPDMSQAVLQVCDNGPGLPEDALRVIFDPFVLRTDSPMEYGINLMACYFIVHHHGGTIEARSEEGQGTSFTLRLMANPNHPPSGEESRDLFQKILMNETLWEGLISS